MRKLGKKVINGRETIEAYCTTCSYCGCSCSCQICTADLLFAYYVGFSVGNQSALSGNLTSNGSYASLG